MSDGYKNEHSPTGPNLDPYITEAHSIVDMVISNAILNNEKYLSKSDINSQIEDENIEHQQYNVTTQNVDDVSSDKSNINWLTAQEFDIQKGKQKIEEFIKTWKHDESWLYCIDFLTEEEYDCDVRYRYRVRWSIPTRRKPIPRATASVYFTVKISKFKPKSFPVEVYYIFETNTLVHRPGKSKFHQKWLKDIIDSKIIMMEGIKF
eukprot:gene11307-12489_t